MISNLTFSISKTWGLALSFAVGLAISAQISIPFYPVPFTLQTLWMMLAIYYNREIAFKSMCIYLGFSVLGLPVLADFSNAWGLWTKPSAGYVVGFWLAAWLVWRLKNLSDLSAVILSQVIVLVCGVSYLTYFIGFQEAFIWGGLVFIIPDILKGLGAYYLHQFIFSNSTTPKK